MARRRSSSEGEVSLFPFLSILACLIGALILLIVVLVVTQTRKSDGRTPEEIEMAQDYQELLKREREQKETQSVVEVKLAELEKLRKEQEDLERKIARIRMLLSTSSEMRANNAEIGQNRLKELDNLLLEIKGLVEHEMAVKQQLANLMAEIAKRQPPAQKVTPPVVVQPGGSGLAKGSKVFFVEATAGKLAIYWDPLKKTVVSASDEVIAADVAYNDFLKRVQAVPNSKIVFLLRDDGMAAFNKGAGWAQATYGYEIGRIGKLPIPGRGEIDLKMFKDYLGELTPPPEAKIVAPPAASKPG